MPRRSKKKRLERISTEEQRLREILAGMPDDMLRLVDGLIQRAAFLRVELEDLEDDINKNGSTEIYQASEHSPPMTRIRAAAQHYDKMARQYLATCKQLAELASSTGAVKGESKGGESENPFEKLVQSRIQRVK